MKSVSTLALNCRIFPPVAVDVGSISNRFATDWYSFGRIIIDRGRKFDREVTRINYDIRHKYSLALAPRHLANLGGRFE